MKAVYHGSALLALFVVGVLAYPTWHKTQDPSHCADIETGCSSTHAGIPPCEDSHPIPLRGHSGTHCPICQLVHTPLLAVVPLISAITVALSIENLSIPLCRIPFSERRRFAQARAPPSA